MADLDDVYAFLSEKSRPRIVRAGWERMVRQLVSQGRARVVGQRRVHHGPRNSVVRIAMVAEAVR